MVSVPGGGTAKMRYWTCIYDNNGTWMQGSWTPYGHCGVNSEIPNGSRVTMRCYLDGQKPSQAGEDPSWTSPRWFFSTLDSGNAENNISGFIYSALIPVSSQVRTPSCNDRNFSLDYPYQPSQSSAGITDISGGTFTVSLNNIALGPATIYCHIGSSGYPTGGSVHNLGQYTIDVNETIRVPICGSGIQWVGLAASNGIIRYTSTVNVGGSGGSGGGGTQPTPGYLQGIAGQPLDIETTNGYRVNSTITVSGYPAKNFGQTNVTVTGLALAALAPDGHTIESDCYENLTVAPQQTVYCSASFLPEQAGTWQLNLDWQGSDGTWTHLYEPLNLDITDRPENDDFGMATDIVGSGQIDGTLVGATAEPGEPGHLDGYPAQNSVWFRYTAAVTGRAWFSMDDTSHAPVAVAAYQGTALGDLTQLARWQGTNNDEIAFAAEAGSVYWIALDDYGEGTPVTFSGTYRVDPYDRPPNDAFVHAATAADGREYEVHLTDATVDPGEPAIGIDGENAGTVWYRYRTRRDAALTIRAPQSARGQADGADVAIFAGTTLPTLRRLATGFVSPWSSNQPLVVRLAGGKSYWIAVDNIYPADPNSGVPQDVRFDFTVASAATSLASPRASISLNGSAYNDAFPNGADYVLVKSTDPNGVGISRYIVKSRLIYRNGAGSGWKVSRSIATTVADEDGSSTPVSLPLAPRSATICYAAQSADALGRLSALSGESCYAGADAPTRASHSGRWSRVIDKNAVGGVTLQSTAKGAKYVLPPTRRLREFGFAAAQGRRAADVWVYVNGKALWDVDLRRYRTGRANIQQWIITLRHATSGTVALVNKSGGAFRPYYFYTSQVPTAGSSWR